jgi:hypothetical protein
VVLDARALAFFPDLEEALRELRPTVVYLEARPEVLLRRYNLTRRLHPLGAGNLMREIGQEREVLSVLREKAHLVLDTSDLSPRALKEALARFLGEEAGFILRLLSFGFKWGGRPRRPTWSWMPAPSPTPTTTPSSSPKTGLDPEVRAYVFREEEEPFYRALLAVAGLSAEGGQEGGAGLLHRGRGVHGGAAPQRGRGREAGRGPFRQVPGGGEPPGCGKGVRASSAASPPCAGSTRGCGGQALRPWWAAPWGSPPPGPRPSPPSCPALPLWPWGPGPGPFWASSLLVGGIRGP